MESSGILLGLIIAGLFTVISSEEFSQELASDDAQLSQKDPENEFVNAVGALLRGFKDYQQPGKRGIPLCAVGSRCAMRVGSRFGILCECGRGSNCNSFLLKCI